MTYSGTSSGLAVTAGAYAIGCLVTAYYAVRWRSGADIRLSGSGNAGATNAGRSLGKAWFAAIALADIFRGWLAVWIAQRAGLSPAWQAAAGLAVTAGHIWPAQLGWRGGKGIATGYGSVLAVSPHTAALMWAVLVLGRVGLRSTTLGGLMAFLVAPVLAACFQLSAAHVLMLGVLAGLLLFTHRCNLRAELGRQTVLPPSTPPPPHESTAHPDL